MRDAPRTPNLIFFCIREVYPVGDSAESRGRWFVIRVAVVARAHAEILVNNGNFAVIPFFGKERHDVHIGDRIEDMDDTLRGVCAVTLPDIQEILLAIFIFGDNDTVAVGDDVVFIEFRMRVVAADLTFVDELEVELDDRLLGIKGEDTPTPVADGIKIAGWLYLPGVHRRVITRFS